MVFQPPLTRKQYGHYWRPEVFLTFALLFVNVTLQVVLTVVAGRSIVANDYEFKESLIGSKLAASPYTWLAANASGQADHIVEQTGAWDVVDNVYRIAGVNEEDQPPRCCNGATCASLGLQCCDRSSAKPHAAYHPMRPLEARIDASEGETAASFLGLSKPGGKSGKKEGQQASNAGVSSRSICVVNGSNAFHCNPVSYSFVDRWDDLDTNKDGKWTLDEARADEANLGCRLGIPPEDVFRSNCRGVLRDVADTIKHHHLNYSFVVPESITEYEAVPKEYFDWWAGLAVICVDFDSTRCSSLVARGLFDSAIDSGKRWTTGGVSDLDSALDYCERLLQPGGLCEQSLPGFYLTYRSRVHEKCGPPVFTAGKRYVNPFNARDAMTSVDVSYKQVDTYVEYGTIRFRFFLFMILMLWYVNLLDEFRDVVKSCDFLCRFPVDSANPWVTPDMRNRFAKLRRSFTPDRSNSQPDLDAEDEMEVAHGKTMIHDRLVVENIAWPHWLMCLLMCVVRLCLVVYLFYVGTTFLLTDQGYVDLLLNSVALAFILDLPVLLYVALFSDKAKKALDGAHTLEFETGLPKSGFAMFCSHKSVWGILILPPLVYWVVNFNHRASTLPLLEALRCTCLQEGPMCEVAHRFTRDWWNSYWAHINFMFTTNTGSYVKLG